MARKNIAICTKRPLNEWTESVFRSLKRFQYNPTVLTKPEDGPSSWSGGWIKIVPEYNLSTEPSYWTAARQLEKLSVPLLNSTTSHLLAHNKQVASQLFVESMLASPATWLLPESASLNLYYPLVCKPISASRGFGVCLVRDYKEAQEHENSLGVQCLLQERIDSARCLRVICTPDRCVRIYEKKAELGVLVASVALGAKRLDVKKINPEVERIAQRMVSCVGGGLMGVDILEDKNGKLWSLEVNANFAFDADDQVVADSFAEEMLKINVIQ